MVGDMLTDEAGNKALIHTAGTPFGRVGVLLLRSGNSCLIHQKIKNAQ